MVKLTLQNFGGEIPRRDPNYLPDSNAVEASNLKLTGGTLRAMRGQSVEHELPAAAWSIYRHNGIWHSWGPITSVVPGPVADDRLYVTLVASIPPQIYADSNWFPMAFPRATARPTVSATGAVDDDLAEIVKYAYTLVSTLGEETAPSNLSFGVKFNEGRTITLTGLPNSSSMNNRDLAGVRIYRSQTSASGVTDLYFIAEISPLAGIFVDEWGQNDIQEPCPTKDFESVPNNLHGLTGMPNGIMAGFRGRELLFCEPYQPHAWPQKYRIYLDYEIVGLASVGTSLIVLTRGMPYIVQGLHPDSMAQAKVETTLPCLYARSIVDMGASVIYASNDGLVQISETGAQLISREIWSKDEWAELSSQTIRAARYGDSYIFSYEVMTGRRRGYIVTPGDGQATLTQFNFAMRGFWNDPATNELFSLHPNGTTIQRFDAPDAEALNFVWRSKTFRFVEPTSFSALLIEAADRATPAIATGLSIAFNEEYAIALANLTGSNVPGQPQELLVTIPDPSVGPEGEYDLVVNINGGGDAEGFRVRIYGDGTLLYSVESGMNRIQRIPSRKCRQWQIEISGTTEVMRCIMAQSPAEVWT